mgnify:FL=1
MANEEIINSEFYLTLKKLIREEIRRELKNTNVEQYEDLQVVSYDSTTNTCNCKDMITLQEYSNVPNYTGDVLESGNIVRLYKNGQDRFIGTRLKQKEAI